MLYLFYFQFFLINCEKRKSLESIAGIGKIAASVLLKLFINGNEICPPPLPPIT